MGHISNATTITKADITNLGIAPLNSPILIGIPKVPTPSSAANEEQLYELIKCNIKIISQNNNILILSCDSRPQIDLNLLILLKQGED